HAATLLLPAMTRSRSFIAVIGVAAFAAACHRDPRLVADDAVSRADQYLARHQHAEAIIEYRRAIPAMPERVGAHWKLAKLYLDDRQSGDAYAEFSRATDLDPTLVDAQVEAGNLLLQSGQFREAKARAEAAIAADPRSGRAHILLGNALAGLRDT